MITLRGLGLNIILLNAWKFWCFFFSNPLIFSHIFLCHVDKDTFKLLEKPSRWAKPVSKVQLFGQAD